MSVFKGESRMMRHTWQQSWSNGCHWDHRLQTIIHCDFLPLLVYGSGNSVLLWKYSSRYPAKINEDCQQSNKNCLHAPLMPENFFYLFLRACCLLRCLLIETQLSAILPRWTSMWSMGSENAVSLSTSLIHLCQVRLVWLTCKIDIMHSD